MHILHIETSTKICSIAVSYGKEVLGFLDLTEGMNHTALLAPAINELLKSKSIKPGDLAAVSVSSGPGSYTGLRVGSSTAKAMAYALGIPLLPVPSLYALAGAAIKQQPKAQLVIPMIDARRNEVYTAVYDQDLQELVPVSSMLLDTSSLERILDSEKLIILCGDGSWKDDQDRLPEHTLIDRSIQSSAIHLVDPAYDMFLGHRHGDILHFVPFYLKPPNITQPRTLA